LSVVASLKDMTETVPAGHCLVIDRIAADFQGRNRVFESGTAEAGSGTTLQDTDKTWTGTNIWAGYRLYLTGGTGSGQNLLIASNTSDTLTVSGGTFSPAPGNDTTYEIRAGSATAGAISSVNFRITDGASAHSNMPILVPTQSGLIPSFNIDWQPRSSLALGPGMSIKGYVSENVVAGLNDLAVIPTVWARMMSLEEARVSKIAPIVWNGTAFTMNGFARGLLPADTSASTSGAWIPAIAGKSIQIEFLHIVAFGDSATNENLLLEFSNGTNHYKVARIYAKQTNLAFRHWITAPGLELNGPYGYYLRATASKANTFSVTAIGRYVDNHKTMDPTGVHTGPLAPGDGPKWWKYYEGTNLGSGRVFADSASVMCSVEGVLMSASAGAVNQIMTLSTADHTALASIGPTLQTGADRTMLVNEVDSPLFLTGATTSLWFAHGASSGSFAGTAWGKLMPASRYKRLNTVYRSV